MGNQNSGRKKGIQDYPLNIVEEAVQLALTFKSFAAAEREMGRRYPDRPTPTILTIKKWAKRFQPKEIRNKIELVKPEIAAQWLDIEILSLRYLEQRIMSGGMSDQQLAVLAGISADKRLKLMELARSKTPNVMNIYALVQERRMQIEQEKLEEKKVLEGDFKDVDQPARWAYWDKQSEQYKKEESEVIDGRSHQGIDYKLLPRGEFVRGQHDDNDDDAPILP